MSLLGKIRKYNSAAAKELENANFRTDSEIKSLDRTDLYELFPEKKNLKLRKDINEIIHPKRPVEDLVRELKGFIPHESACAAKSSDPSGPATFSNCQTGHIPPETRGFLGADLDSDKNGVISPDLGNQLRHPREDSQGFSKSEKRKEEAGGGAGNSSDLLPSVLREVKYNMIVDGQTLNAHQPLMNELLSQQQAQDCQFSESSDDHQVTLLFKPISSHMESDVEAAMSRIKDNKPVILVLMHHFYQPKFTSSPRILKDHPNVVLAVHGVSERRNLEAEGGGAKTTDPSGPVTFSSPQIGHIPPGTPAGNSSDLLPSVLREVKYNMIVDGQTLNAHQQLMNELLSQQQVQDCQFSESSDDHQVTLLFKPISSHMESDVEAAMSRIKDNKPVILVLMHHFYEPKSTSSPRILKDYPNVVLAVHVFFHDTKSGLLTCRENSAAISSIRDKLLEYSTLVIPGENLQGVSERRNLEAEGGAGNSSDLLPSVLREDNKPVILVLMHHFYQPKFTSSPRILKDHPNVVLAVHVFVDWTRFRLLTCRENSAAISSIRDKLLEYSRPMIPGENLQGVSGRKNLEAEGGGKKQNFYDYQKGVKRVQTDRVASGFLFGYLNVNYLQELFPEVEKLKWRKEIYDIIQSPKKTSSLFDRFKPSSVKYQILKSGNPLDVYHQVIKKVARKSRVRFVEAPGDHKVSILFCPVISRIGSDAETAIATIKDDKPVILVFLIHSLKAQSLTLLKSWDHPNIVLHAHLFHHQMKSGLLRCKENKTAISAIKKKLKNTVCRSR
ncbi:hypothetical protein D4764_19G0008030 [Takifugu flavidus]|uniref:Uncharacterized protein n=1 Tax=Takifugu flavidus TaxID=433684 RepID=A0A5C6NPZ6_9TELE|nr:hypothetical protein D4764_19G0008030 [Takifugu flavidus]